MRIISTALILIIFTLPCFAQGGSKIDRDQLVNESKVTHLVFAVSVNHATELSLTDISNGTPFLILQSGIAPTVYPGDSAFEKSYNVNYYESGCTGAKLELVEQYNATVFNYLVENYPKTKWKKEMRKDVIGWKKWKRKIRFRFIFK